MDKIDDLIDTFITDIKRGRIQGSFKIALTTTQIIREIIVQYKFEQNLPNTQNLINLIRNAGNKLIESLPNMLVIGNIVRRILFIIREEHVNAVMKINRKRNNIFIEGLGSVVLFSKNGYESSKYDGKFYINHHGECCNVTDSNIDTIIKTIHTKNEDTAVHPFRGGYYYFSNQHKIMELSSSLIPKLIEYNQTEYTSRLDSSKRVMSPLLEATQDDRVFLKMVDVDGQFYTLYEINERFYYVVEEHDRLHRHFVKDSLKWIKKEITSFDFSNQQIFYMTQKQTDTVYHEKNLSSNFSLTEDVKDYSIYTNIRDEIFHEIKNLVDELNVEEGDDLIANLDQHIHTNEIILTVGSSNTVKYYLEQAHAKKIQFEAIVAEHAPEHDGMEMAEHLGQLGIPTTLISDAAIYSVMSRVHKVLIGTHAILANGGLLAPAGTHMLALAAKKHSIPVVVCSGIYKLSPTHPTENMKYSTLLNPSSVLKFSEVYHRNIHVYNPSFDYVPPELVDLFITNSVSKMGANALAPSYLYRVLAELYDPEDYWLSSSSIKKQNDK
mmetsp:Transcript_1592/g.2381  ORF Transcript_1592/g.2381 Transcript_1592/m.2381 type:complete len:552 (-) Transcript_1592:65-1720(-)